MTPSRYPSDVVAGEFRLDRRIGRGGFSEVWAAEHISTGQRCALKILDNLHAYDRSLSDRLRREGEILADLDHPNIAGALSYDVADDSAYIAMELVEGVSLNRELLARTRGENFFGADALLSVLQPIAAALDYAHGRGVLHRDLKPSNVVLTPSGTIKLLDFGVAKLLSAPADLETTAGRIVGSKHYLSPEQIKSDRVDVPADVFALATVTFVMLTHHQPWAHDREGRPVRYDALKQSAFEQLPAVLQRISAGPRPRPSECREGVGAALDELMTRAFAIDPAARPSSASAFVGELGEALAGSEAFTKIVDVSAEMETALITQHVEADMVLDETEEEPFEVIDLSAVRETVPAVPTPPPAAPPARWFGAALGVAAALVLVTVVVAFATKSEPPVPRPAPAEPSAAARPTPAPRPVPQKIEPEPEPAPAPPPKPVQRRAKPTRLDRVLVRLERDGDQASIDSAVETIEALLPRVADDERRTSVRRCTVASSVLGDAHGLAGCVRDLRSLLRGGPP